MCLPNGNIIETLWIPHRVTNLTKFIAKENNSKLPERQKWMQSHKWLWVGFVPLCPCSPTTVLPRGPSASLLSQKLWVGPSTLVSLPKLSQSEPPGQSQLQRLNPGFCQGFCLTFALWLWIVVLKIRSLKLQDPLQERSKNTLITSES